MKTKIFLWGTIAAAVCGLVYFRGDIQRYTKMKMM
jgi:hypothetical protein